MATLTVDRFLDAAACTAGETFTMNGARLTIRSDTRFHANSPASMTGAIGSLTISSTLGGGVTLDGTKVRWMPYNTGTGNVPAVGTSITQGGVTGVLLGVWASITAAPTAVGAAMPASGFIKFREVTSGPFAAGALTGIGASATGPDVVGWIEVVMDQSATITVPRLGDFTTRGDWFDLGVTTGAANQLVSLPTNGSATAYTPGVWIANTATPLTDEDWDFYPAVYAAAMITTNLGTDIRSKFVCMETNGSIRIGHNGTTSVGYVPPSGRKIRVGNIFGRQCTAAARATNVTPHTTLATRPDFTTTNAGVIDIENFTTDWYLAFAQAYSVRLWHVATFEAISLVEIAAPIDMYDGGVGMNHGYDGRAFVMTSNFGAGDIEKFKFFRHVTGSNDHVVEIQYCQGQNIINCESGTLTYARSTGGSWIFLVCSGITLTNLRQFNASMVLTTCFDMILSGIDHCDRFTGVTNTTTGLYAITFASGCSDIVVDGTTFGMSGQIADNHPYNGIFSVSGCTRIKLRNAGSRASFLSGGAANSPAYIFVSGGNNKDCKVQRCYMTPTRTGALGSINSDKGMIYEHVYGDFADTITINDLNGKVKNCGATNGTTGSASVYGTHFASLFTSNTTGRLVLAMNEPTDETDPFVTLVSGTPKFTSAGNLVLAAVGDEVVFETEDYVLGVTGFANIAPVVTGTNVTFSSGSRWGNHDLYYQIDKGAGYGGSWVNFNQANLFAETGFDPAVGFKIKFRAVCAIAATANLLTFVRFSLESTLAAQTDNLYPLDVASVIVSGLVSGSRVKATKVFDGSVLFNGLETSGIVSFETDYVGAVNIEARKASATPFYQPWLTQITTVADATTTAIALQTLDE